MIPIDKCLFCEGKVSKKQVTEIIKGGGNTATLTVNALVCENCGERYYDIEIVKKFELIKSKLETQQTEGFVTMGKSFEVV